MSAGRARRGMRGFTLLEVMVGLALLGFALTVLLKSAASSIFNARQAQMMGVVTELARGKMYDVEEELIKDGFNETGLSDADDTCSNFQPFDDEGWPGVKWCAKIQQVELPNWNALQDMATRGAGAGSGSGSGVGPDGEPTGGFQDSALGGMLSMLGGEGGTADADAMQGASFIQSQYTMVQEVLKVSIRKVTLFVEWEVMGSKRDLQVVAFFTDATAMDKVLSGLGSQDLGDEPEPTTDTGGRSTGTTGGSTRGGTSTGGRGGSTK